LISRKIIKIVATRCDILRLKCTIFDFGRGCAPDPTGGAHSAPPDALAGFKGSYKRRGGSGSERGKGRGRKNGRERGGKGREGSLHHVLGGWTP